MSNMETVLLQIAKEYEAAQACNTEECAKRQAELELQCIARLKSEKPDLIDFFSRCDLAVFRFCSCFFGELTEDNEVLKSLIPVVEIRYGAAAKEAKTSKAKQLLAAERDSTIEDIILTLNQRGAKGF